MQRTLPIHEPPAPAQRTLAFLELPSPAQRSQQLDSDARAEALSTLARLITQVVEAARVIEEAALGRAVDERTDKTKVPNT